MLIKQKDIKTEFELRLKRAELKRLLFYKVKEIFINKTFIQYFDYGFLLSDTVCLTALI